MKAFTDFVGFLLLLITIFTPVIRFDGRIYFYMEFVQGFDSLENNIF